MSTSKVIDPKLTAHQIRILEYVASGYSAGQIAVLTNRALSTIETNIKSIRYALGADNAPHAVTLGFRHGFLKV